MKPAVCISGKGQADEQSENNVPRASVRLIPAVRLVCLGACLLLASGCSTTKSACDQGQAGTQHVFRSDYTTIWTAALSAAEMDDLCVVDSNKATGHILAKRGIGMTTFGERVQICVRPLTPDGTSVQVVSRHLGPPVLSYPNWEKPVLKNIATMVDEK
ncbi:MAG: hypothetical protein JWQ04_984 [Pedosphaera sp.]|nr:hypothetical protein [Pedosphaera sp.]